MEDRMRIPLEASSLLLVLGAFLTLIGLFLVFMVLFSSGRMVEAEGGGFIIIGPIPIILQGRLGPLAALLIVIAIIIVFLLPLLHLLRFKRGAGAKGEADAP